MSAVDKENPDNRPLSRQICLADGGEPVALENISCEFVILHVKRQERTIPGTHNQAVSVVNVDLSLKKGHQHGSEAGRSMWQFSHNKGRVAEMDLIFVENFSSLVGIVHHESNHGRIRGVHHRQTQDVDIGLAETPCQIQQTSTLILQKNGKLMNQGTRLGPYGVGGGGSFGGHEATGQPILI